MLSVSASISVWSYKAISISYPYDTYPHTSARRYFSHQL